MKNRYFVFVALCMSFSAMYAQQPQEQGIRLRIDAEVDGEHITLDTTIDNLTDLQLEEMMRNLGLEEELGEINIDIRSDYANSYWDAKAMEDLMQSLGDLSITIPEIPTLPDLENLVPMDISMYASESPNKALMGVYSEKVPEGAKITGLTEGGAALAAGLQEADIILAIDKRTIESPANLSEVIGMYMPGDEVTVTYLRDGKEMTTKLTLQENTEAFAFPDDMQFDFNINDSIFNGQPFVFDFATSNRGFLGVYLEDGEEGALITGLEENSAASEAGLKEGDILVSLDKTTVKTYDDVVAFMQQTTPGQKIQVTYMRDGKRKEVDVTLKEQKGGMYFFNEDGGDEGGYFYGPDLKLLPTPCPPGSCYSYVTRDSSKRVYIAITTQPKSGDPMAHPLLQQDNLAVFSNPSDGTFQVQFTLPDAGDTYVSISDVNGKAVYEENLSNFSGTYQRSIDLGDMAKGTYFVRVMQNGYTATQTVIIQ